MRRLLPCLLPALLILPSCGSVAGSAQKYQVSLGLKVGWKDGGPFVGLQLNPLPPPSLPSTPPSSPPDAAGRAFDSLVSPVGSSGKTPVPGPS